MFTICQANLKLHPTLLLATLIHRPHNHNAISRSPSGESICAMHRDLPKQTPGACPARAAGPLNTVTAKPEKSHAVFATPAVPSAMPQQLCMAALRTVPRQQGMSGHATLAGQEECMCLSGDSNSWELQWKCSSFRRILPLPLPLPI